MQAVIDFISAHGKDILLAVVAIDAALLPLFPSSGILLKLKGLLGNVAPKQ